MKASKTLYAYIKADTKMTESEFSAAAKDNQVVKAVLAFLKKELEAQALVTEGDYDSPSWSHKQADRNGYCRGLKKAIDLME